MYCKNCGKEINEGQAICLNCGVKAGEGAAFCENCAAPVDAGAEVCLNCGMPLKKGSSEYLNGKDKTTMALICFFLGSFGIHNFMMGETKKGILKIVLTCCLFIGFIFMWIDFFKIVTDKYVVDPEALI